MVVIEITLLGYLGHVNLHVTMMMMKLIITMMISRWLGGVMVRASDL